MNLEYELDGQGNRTGRWRARQFLACSKGHAKGCDCPRIPAPWREPRT